MKLTFTAAERRSIAETVERLNAFLAGKTEHVESLDGKPLTGVEKEAVRTFRAGIPFAEAECRTWRALSPGEDALIKALRDAKIYLIPDFATSVLCYPSDNGKSVYSHNCPIGFTTSPSTPSHIDEKIIAALKRIKRQEAQNEAR
ncbi:MAG: hypothetical protein J6L64_00200 [Opitutales bacterium]|nr:hypothetical protein [Opitutales bacterium]